MQLRYLELPSSEDMPSLARVVSWRMELRNVTGDLGPLLSSLTCPGLYICNMGLDQAATSSLVRGLQQRGGEAEAVDRSETPHPDPGGVGRQGEV